MRKMLHPYAIGLQVTPRIAIAPIIIAWAGFGYNSKIWIAAIIAFFPVYVNALTGILTVDEDSREMFRSLGASKWQTFMRLMVPSSLPIMFAGLKTAAGLALVGAVVGEFISAQRGLGVLVQQFSYQLAVDDAFAIIVVLMLMGLLLYGVMEWIERVTVFWLHDKRLVARTKRRAARPRSTAAPGSTQCHHRRGSLLLIARKWAWLPAVAALAIAGCGGDDESSGGGSGVERRRRREAGDRLLAADPGEPRVLRADRGRAARVLRQGERHGEARVGRRGDPRDRVPRERRRGHRDGRHRRARRSRPRRAAR